MIGDIPKEVIDKALPPFEKKDYSKLQPEAECVYFSTAVSEYAIKATETEDAFIFEYIQRFCNGALTTHDKDLVIPKQLLTRALECFREEHKEEWDHLMKENSDETSF